MHFCSCLHTSSRDHFPGYDWCVCLEVFEHVPKHLESQLVLASDSEMNVGVIGFMIYYIYELFESRGHMGVMMGHLGTRCEGLYLARDIRASVWPVWPWPRWNAF